MPEEMHRKLAAEALKKGFGKKRAASYVYGTLAKMKKKMGKMGKMEKTERGEHHG